jgi:hypothetical protein
MGISPEHYRKANAVRAVGASDLMEGGLKAKLDEVYHHNPAYAPVGAAAMKHVHAYKDDSAPINAPLRAGRSSSSVFGAPQENVATLDKLTSVARHAHDLHVYRGFKTRPHWGMDGHADNPPEHGDVFHDKGFVSTTLNPFTARGNGYSPSRVPDTKELHNHFAHIVVPKGKGAFMVDHPNGGVNHEHHEEHEVILPRNSRFRYLGSSHSVAGTQNHLHEHIHHFEMVE